MKDEALRQALEWIEDAVVVLSHTSSAVQGGIGAEAEGVGGCSVKVITDIKQALAQPEPEPVKVMGFDCVCGRRMVVESDNGVVASPPKREWQGLTDEEVFDIWLNEMPAPDKVFYQKLCRSVEAKLKQKNHDQR